MSIINPAEKTKTQTPRDTELKSRKEKVAKESKQASSRLATIAKLWDGTPEWFLKSKPAVLSLWYPLWWVYRVTQIYRLRWIPIPYYWGSLRRRTKDNYAYIYKNENKSMGIFSAISAKGGALKTTVATWMAATYSYHTKGVSIVFDADSGALGSAAKRLEAKTDGKSEHNLLTADIGAKLVLNDNWQPDYQELLRFAPRSMESGVYVMSMDGITNWSDKSTQKILEGYKRACGSLFVDTGPGEKESNTKGVVLNSTVVVVTGIHKNISTDDAIRVTLESTKYNLMGRKDRVLIAIGAVNRRDYNRRTQHEIADQFDIPPGQIILLPDHKRILKGDTVRQGKISKKFLYAMSELNRKRVEAAIEFNESNPLSFPHRQQEQNLIERREAAADHLLYMSNNSVDKACQFLFDYAHEKNKE